MQTDAQVPLQLSSCGGDDNGNGSNTNNNDDNNSSAAGHKSVRCCLQKVFCYLRERHDVSVQYLL